jgi:hypothetical protein
MSVVEVYRLPEATTRRITMKKKWYVNRVKALGRGATFSGDMEQVLVDHVTRAFFFFGLSIKDVGKLAFDLAEKYKLPHTFNKEKKIGGEKWFSTFMRR